MIKELKDLNLDEKIKNYLEEKEEVKNEKDEESYHQFDHLKKKGILEKAPFIKKYVLPVFQTGLNTLNCLGIVFGDLGTSPLYVYSSIFTYGQPNEEDILGACCLIVYSILIWIFYKYVVNVLNYDNKGEGGLFMLSSLLPIQKKGIIPTIKRVIAMTLSIVGSSFVLGDGCITPAISILSALEGISVYSPEAEPAIVPISCVIAVLLFLMQSFGTSIIGLLFGPIILLWFIGIGGIGIYNITFGPSIFLCFNPWYGILFFINNGVNAFYMLGGVVLCITGVEAMYADIGHFGKLPVRLATVIFAIPASKLSSNSSNFVLSWTRGIFNSPSSSLRKNIL
jgi:KUP system potassium uptake protein